MQITVKKLTDINLMRRACELTIDGVSNAAAKKLYQNEHSPIRTQIFWIEMLGIPTFVSTHFIRHSIGVSHYALTQRDDRRGCDPELSNRLTPTNHGMLINAQSLINMAQDRLCGRSHSKTIEAMEIISHQVGLCDPDLKDAMIRKCEYRGFCPEGVKCSRYRGL